MRSWRRRRTRTRRWRAPPSPSKSRFPPSPSPTRCRKSSHGRSRTGGISVGRTGCDMNFGSDSLLAAKHLEVRIAEGGAATLADMGQAPSGVFLRVRTQQPVELLAGDVVRVGEQQLRVDLG